MNNGQPLSNKFTTFSLPLIVDHIIIVANIMTQEKKCKSHLHYTPKNLDTIEVRCPCQ